MTPAPLLARAAAAATGQPPEAQAAPPSTFGALKQHLRTLDAAGVARVLRRLARRARAEARAAALDRVPVPLYELWRLRSFDPFVARASTVPLGTSGKHFVIFAGLPIAGSGGGPRSAQLALELLDHAHRVTYVHRFRGRGQRRRRSLAHQNLTQVGFQEFSARQFVAERAAAEQLFAVCALPLAEYAVTLRYLRAHGARAVYDCAEDWRSAAWASRWYARRAEDALLSQADEVLAASPALERQLVARAGRQVTVLENAVDTRLFARGRPQPRPRDMPTAEAVFTCAGFPRHERLAWDWLLALADAAPRCAVVLLGDERGPRGRVPSNLHLCGPVLDSELPAWFAHSDVGLAPLRPGGPRTPLRVLEAVAMGLPVVASALSELRPVPGVALATSAEEFVAAVQRARGARVPEPELTRFVAEHSWRARLRQLERLLGV